MKTLSAKTLPVVTGNRVKKTHAQFLIDAKAVHGDRFKYLSQYVSARVKMKIECSVGHVFMQVPGGHLYGRGCPQCAGAKKTHSEFVTKARDIHGDKFKYLSPYNGAFVKMEMECPNGHIFMQTPTNHLSGRGCVQCETKSHTQFLIDARAVHDDKYRYLSKYRGSHIKLEIQCEAGHMFTQTPANHIAGHGCPDCARGGFKPAKPAYLYLLLADTLVHGEVIKVGITGAPKERLSNNRARDSINWKFGRLIKYDDGIIPMKLERKLIKFFGKPFDGFERFVCEHSKAICAFDTIIGVSV